MTLSAPIRLPTLRIRGAVPARFRKSSSARPSQNRWTHPQRAGEMLHSLADIARMREAIDYEPQWDLSRGLARSLEYYAQPAALSSGRAVEEGAAG